MFTYEGKGAFGELALMYNCPRAATVQVSSKSRIPSPPSLWQMPKDSLDNAFAGAFAMVT